MNKRLCLYFDENFYKKIKEEAKKKGMKISEYIRYCITVYWEK